MIASKWFCYTLRKARRCRKMTWKIPRKRKERKEESIYQMKCKLQFEMPKIFFWHSIGGVSLLVGLTTTTTKRYENSSEKKEKEDDNDDAISVITILNFLFCIIHVKVAFVVSKYWRGLACRCSAITIVTLWKTENLFVCLHFS